MKKLRIFYDESGQVIYTHGLEGPGKFPETKSEDLLNYPKGTKCIEKVSESIIESFMASDDNKVENGKLIVGIPRPFIPIPEPRDLQAELDALKSEVEELKKEIYKV